MLNDKARDLWACITWHACCGTVLNPPLLTRCHQPARWPNHCQVLTSAVVLLLQSCYGHTEGTAGVTGALLALCTVSHMGSPPIVNLRNVNPYVIAALADWSAQAGKAVLVPRQYAPRILSKVCLPAADVQTNGHILTMMGSLRFNIVLMIRRPPSA